MTINNRNSSSELKIMAFFLPQFHTDPYNDKWWGKGFTEWVSVKAARPLFPDHNQPKIPLDNNYYQLDEIGELDKQFNMAKDHGIDGFVFYHYWSLGTRLLKKPLDLLLDNPDIGINSEFSLCWANHSWTRSWKNRQGSSDVLLEQEYEKSEDEMKNHIDFLVRCFSDPRYTRLDGTPILYLYRPEAIPNLNIFVKAIKKATKQAIGVECHISGVITAWQKEWNYLDCLDSATAAQPALSLYSPEHIFQERTSAKGLFFNPSSYVRGLPKWTKKFLYPIKDIFFNQKTIFDYDETWKKLLRQIKSLSSEDKIFHFSTFIDFDNTARYGKRAKLFKGFSPEKFERYFLSALKYAKKNKRSNILLINAWNEWGEGMYLQADEAYGNARLEAIKRSKDKLKTK